MRRVLIFIGLFAMIFSEAEELAQTFCYFTPPSDWEIAAPETLAPSVKIAFIKKSSKGLCSSLNLAIEEVDVSMSEYLKVVQNIHEHNRNNQWRKLGKIQTSAGSAQLTEIDTTTEFGPLRMLQLILIKDRHAYILTAAALKEEFPAFYKDFQKAFRSLTLTHDLLSTIPQHERREKLKQSQLRLLATWRERLAQLPDPQLPLANAAFQKEVWNSFQTDILEHFSDMGAFWQVLFLRTSLQGLVAETDAIAIEQIAHRTEKTPS